MQSKKHFRVKNIKNWVDSNQWQLHYPDFHKLSLFEKEEIHNVVIQSSATLTLRNWQETCALLLVYLRKSPSSPLKNMKTMFARYEYQKDVGNLSHIHFLAELNWSTMNAEEKKFVKDMIRASVLDIVRTDEMQRFIDDGILDNQKDYILHNERRR